MAGAERMKTSLDEWVAFAEALADESRAMFGAAGAPVVALKPDRSFVTDLDERIERRLRERIADRFPTHGIIGEEGGDTGPARELTWVLDPVDGTAPFIAGVPVYGTLIALLADGVPVLGIIDLPVTGDRWVGATGRTTRHSAGPCTTRACAALSGAILSASNPDFFGDAERPALDALRAATAWRIYGGCCMAYGLLASGRTDLAIDASLKLWDYAPFPPIIEGAGGVVSDWDGRPLALGSGPRILAAGDRDRHREALALVQGALQP